MKRLAWKKRVRNGMLNGSENMSMKEVKEAIKRMKKGGSVKELKNYRPIAIRNVL